MRSTSPKIAIIASLLLTIFFAGCRGSDHNVKRALTPFNLRARSVLVADRTGIIGAGLKGVNDNRFHRRNQEENQDGGEDGGEDENNSTLDQAKETLENAQEKIANAQETYNDLKNTSDTAPSEWSQAQKIGVGVGAGVALCIILCLWKMFCCCC